MNVECPVVKICSGGVNIICKRYEFRPDVEKKSTRKLQTPTKRNGFIRTISVVSLAFVHRFIRLRFISKCCKYWMNWNFHEMMGSQSVSFSECFSYIQCFAERDIQNTKHSQNIQPNDWMYGIGSTYIRPNNTINHWLWYSKWMLKPKMASHQH